MIIGVTGYGKPMSRLQKMYMEQSNFTAIECDGLRRLCNIDLDGLYESEPYVGLNIGLSTRHALEVRQLADRLYRKHQFDIASKAIDKLNYPGSTLFTTGILHQETVKSIDKLKGAFYMSKIYGLTKRRVADYYLLGIDFRCDDITFNNVKYLLETKVLVKDNPFDFKVISVNFDTYQKEGEK